MEQLPAKPAKRIPLTQTAHHFLQEAVAALRADAQADKNTDAAAPSTRPALRAIDATAGNGYDTLFLAQLLGSGSEVTAFDIQQQALDNTALRLQTCASPDTLATVRLIRASHADMLAHLPTDWLGSVGVITFNLGYLPGGDKGIVTLEDSTLPALEASLQLLAPSGLISVMCYRGHEEGAAETQALQAWAQSRLPAATTATGSRFSHTCITARPDAPAHAPLLLHIRRS